MQKKQLGQYWTPPDVVDYIVERAVKVKLEQIWQAVNRLLATGKFENARERLEQFSRIKVLDPACGAGIFLVKVYQTFRSYYELYNQKVRTEAANFGILADCYTIDSCDDKILKENIYGVDLDPAAVQSTKAALLQQSSPGKRPQTPPNIKQGNALIDDDLRGYPFHNPNDYKILANKSPFDWQKEFPEVCQGSAGAKTGFDVVLGNPPYIGFKDYSGVEKVYFRERFGEVYNLKADISYYFIQRGLELLKNKGLLGYITSRYWLEATFAQKLRDYISSQARIVTLIDFKDLKVFAGSGIHACILILEKTPHTEGKFLYFSPINTNEHKEENHQLVKKILAAKPGKTDEDVKQAKIEQAQLKYGAWALVDSGILKIIQRVMKESIPLDELVDCRQGVVTGCDRVFVIDAQIAKNNCIEPEVLKPWIKNSHIQPYYIKLTDKKLIYANHLPESHIPNTIKYLERHRQLLEERSRYRNTPVPMKDLVWGRRPELFEVPEKLVCPYKAAVNTFAYDDKQSWGSADVTFLIPKGDVELSLKYLLGVLNSKLLNFAFREGGFGKKLGSVYEYYPGPVKRMPIHLVDFSDSVEFTIYNKIVELVDENLKANGSQDYINKQINKLVYELYRISHSERLVIEDSLGY